MVLIDALRGPFIAALYFTRFFATAKARLSLVGCGNRRPKEPMKAGCHFNTVAHHSGISTGVTTKTEQISSIWFLLVVVMSPVNRWKLF
jgi:hypothetical protein